LALIDGVEKYAPAEVLEGFEKRSSTSQNDLGNYVIEINSYDVTCS
jgi:hypothetical protein